MLNLKVLQLFVQEIKVWMVLKWSWRCARCSDQLAKKSLLKSAKPRTRFQWYKMQKQWILHDWNLVVSPSLNLSNEHPVQSPASPKHSSRLCKNNLEKQVAAGIPSVMNWPSQSHSQCCCVTNWLNKTNKTSISMIFTSTAAILFSVKLVWVLHK